MEDLPVATLRPTGTGNPTPIAIYYVHADHLGSPRAVTRPADNAIMWQWDNVDPFGVNAPNENPTGQGTFKYALRFPGQYYDAETGSNYNFLRDTYDASTGRYSQSDPIGLRGGTNTYSYVSADPIGTIDPLGLARRDPPFIDYSKGCGDQNHGANIPDLEFGGCCRAHDDCYDDCRNKPSKVECDQAFVSCLRKKCYSVACQWIATIYIKYATTGPDSAAAFGNARRKCGPEGCPPSSVPTFPVVLGSSVTF